MQKVEFCKLTSADMIFDFTNLQNKESKKLEKVYPTMYMMRDFFQITTNILWRFKIDTSFSFYIYTITHTSATPTNYKCIFRFTVNLITAIISVKRCF